MRWRMRGMEERIEEKERMKKVVPASTMVHVEMNSFIEIMDKQR